MDGSGNIGYTLHPGKMRHIFSQEDGKVLDGSLLGDANGVEPGTGRQEESGKWQRPRFTRKALMRCCLVKWIISSTGPKEQDNCSELACRFSSTLLIRRRSC
ncbi:Calsenilin [Anabarilius grahami]|uniref:Calsenilin n=1 Tax=Anabarilius grahami TaxID=495550 RepID=A0A3N0YSF2_ANAGA|nr:Calsenilin [Anabarilius grahami]